MSSLASGTDDRVPIYVVVGLYLAAIFGVAVWSFIKGRQAVADHDGTDRAKVEEHFLASKSFGTILLFLTTFSTIISGYTAYGIPNEAAGAGFISLRWILVFVGILAFYVVVAPRFRRIAAVRNYQSPNDVLADRYNNNVLRIWGAVLLCSPQILYIGVQLISLRDMVGEISRGQIDDEAATWFLVIFIWVSEVIGGFRSVSLTDAIQSGIMLLTFLILPFLLLAKYGGFEGVNTGNDVTNLCQNIGKGLFYNATSGLTQASTDPALGCIGTSAPWFNMYPARGQSDVALNGFGDPALKGLFNACAAPVALFLEVLETDGALAAQGAVAAEFGLAFTTTTFAGVCVPNISTVGLALAYDANAIFSTVPLAMFSFMLATSVGFFNPHWAQRVIAARSDAVVKKSIILTTAGFLIAALPGVLLGITKVALFGVADQRAALPVMIGVFYDSGGFETFYAIMASVAAVAAFMSTADSAAIGVSNVVTVELFQNWLTPNLSADILVIIAKFISLTTLVSARLLLYVGDEFDTLTALNWQVGLGWSVAPAYVLGLFAPDHFVSSTALIIGMVVNLAVLFFVEFFIIESQELPVYIYGGIYGGLCNFAVVLIGNRFLPDSWKDDQGRDGRNAVDEEARKRFGGGEANTLSYDKINEIMQHVKEPVTDRKGQIGLIVGVLLAIFGMPWYGVDGWGSDITDVTAGLPNWAFVIAILGGIEFIILEGVLATWGTDNEDDESKALIA